MRTYFHKQLAFYPLFVAFLVGCRTLPRVDEVNNDTPVAVLNKMTEALVLSKTPNVKLIHLPSDRLRADLEAQGVRFNKRGCPWGWELDRPGWMHPDAFHSTAACMFNDQAHYELPVKVDYWPKNERPDINVKNIER